MKCNRCGKPCRPSESGFGPKCERYVLGTKPRRAKVDQPVKRDALTRDLFAEVPCAS